MLWSLSARLEATSAWHKHEVFEFVACRSGSGWLEFDDRKIALQPLRTLLVAPGVRHRIGVAQGQTAELKILCLSASDVATQLSPAQRDFLDAAQAKAGGYADYADYAADDSRVFDLLALIPDAFAIAESDQLRVVWSAVGLILALHGSAQRPRAAPREPRYRQKMAEIREWLDGRLGQVTTLEEIAARFALSRSLLTREFRRYTGKSLVDYCNARRVEKAAQILAASGVSVTQAALAAGFANLSHFHRQFKATYGVTPAAFRRQLTGVAEIA